MSHIKCSDKEIIRNYNAYGTFKSGYLLKYQTLCSLAGVLWSQQRRILTVDQRCWICVFCWYHSELVGRIEASRAYAPLSVIKSWLSKENTNYWRWILSVLKISSLFGIPLQLGICFYPRKLCLLFQSLYHLL